MVPKGLLSDISTISSPENHGRVRYCWCAMCKNSLPFEVPKSLVDEFLSGQVVLFAGAGISTENKQVLKSTLHEEVCRDLKISAANTTFPAAMELLQATAAGRLGLISAIKSRIEHVQSFPEIYREAIQFHRELATFYQVNTIVTTNWDDFFERECGATPFVTDEDLAFWESGVRRVLKLHGTVNNFGSIVATTTDYLKAAKRLRKSILGAVLQGILATKTLVYVGYSVTDSDFIELAKFVRTSMKGMHKQQFAVTIDGSATTGERLTSMGITPIVTSGTYFIQILKKHALSGNCFLSDDRFDKIKDRLFTLLREREQLREIDHRKHPQVLLTEFYQDGLIHAFENALHMRKSGDYSHSCVILAKCSEYERIRKKFSRAKNFGDEAYVKGYMNGLVALSQENLKKIWPPRYFAFGVGEIEHKSHFKKLLPRLPQLHKSSYRFCEKIMAKVDKSSQVMMSHRPWL